MEHCLNEYDAVSHLAINPAAIEAAIWFHDAIYNSKASDNEEKSASVAVRMLAAMGVRSKLCQDVRKLILHTKHAGVPRTGDGKIMVDVDLAILGSAPAVFSRYEKAIRKEYGWVEESVFWPKRAEFLQTLLSRKRIYVTDFFFKRYEARARKNMSQSIAKAGAAETIR
ncbi:MAG: N-methyl-D-aspartate receptor NMDAR2C subunit [Verrucomicrobia bacterium]|nr:N-methyl-D-aspartate receptor NMDAR2C subunit [Verrucomicrobiota bacterium]